MSNFRKNYALPLLVLFYLGLINSVATANTITDIKVKNPTERGAITEPGKPFGISLQFGPSGSNISCGIAVDWGDGKVEKLRIGEGQQVIPPYYIEHTYSITGEYKFRISGETIVRGIRTVFPCDVSKEALVTVIDAAELARRAELAQQAERERRSREEAEAAARKLKAEADLKAKMEREEAEKTAMLRNKAILFDKKWKLDNKIDCRKGGGTYAIFDNTYGRYYVINGGPSKGPRAPLVDFIYVGPAELKINIRLFGTEALERVLRERDVIAGFMSLNIKIINNKKIEVTEIIKEIDVDAALKGIKRFSPEKSDSGIIEACT